MKKGSLKLTGFVSVLISILLINPASVFAGVKNTGQVSLPEYQQTSNSATVNANISDEEKEKLLNKYFNKSSSSESAKFEKAKKELKKDGFKVVQDGYNPDAWIVSKKIKGETVCFTVYPFNEKGKCTVNVKAINKMFNFYKDLKKAGYKVNCSGKTDLYYYFSLGKGQSFTQLTMNNWTISKGKTKVTLSYFDNKGKALTLSKVKEAFKFEKAKTELKKAGFKFVQDSKNPDAWVARKNIKGETVCLTVYPFNEKGKCTVNTTAITGLFKLYKDLKNKGYKINCAGKTDLYYYFSLGKGQAFTQITGNTWTIKKGNKKIKFSPFDDNGKVRTAASILG